MKTKVSLLFCLALLTAVTVSARTDELFNFDWKFRLGPCPEASQPAFDDSDWRSLDLPHDYQIEMPWREEAGGARGFKDMSEGWYRKTFQARSEWKGQKVILDFEGIMAYGEAYLNGKLIGGTDYGYLGFEADISEVLNYDGDNVLAVWCSTGKKGGSRWYTGGGLFRDVHLTVKNPVNVTRHGLYVSTPEITDTQAQVRVQVDIEGIRGRESGAEVLARIYAPDGTQVGETRAVAPRNLLAINEVVLPTVTLEQPLRWSCEHPFLYTVKVELLKDGEVIDAVEDRFGVRTIEYSKESGFKLNGEKVFLKGIANHHDMGAVGVAAYETSIARMMDQLKAFGYNQIRCSHNPYSEAFLRLADEKGILIVDELYDKWSDKSYWIGRKPWTETWYKDEIEWIRRDRNHPSIILWSFGNELQIREDWAGLPTGDWGITTYRLMKTLEERYDGTRPTTVAMFPARGGSRSKNDPTFNTLITPPELATVTDIASFNYRWYNYKDYLNHAPDMIMYQSEATTNEQLAPFYGMNRETMVGLSYWGAIEYWGESNGWPKKGWNYSFFSHTLEPYPQAYLIQSAFEEDKPLVRIAVMEKSGESIEWNDIQVGGQNVASHWNWEEGKICNLYTYTNADEVELFVNGKSYGTQPNEKEDVYKRNIIYWQNIPYEPGKILAVARTDGRETARHELVTAGRPVAFQVVLENDDWKADGMSLQYINVYAVDNKGRRVATAEGSVKFTVKGDAARLLAVENGDHYTDRTFHDTDVTTLYRGCAQAILRSTRTPGKVSVTVEGAGLRPTSFKLMIRP